MNDLFAPSIPAEHVLSDRLRVHMVDGDRMEPTLKGRRDYVLLAPVSRYAHEGIYLVFNGFGPELYRVQSTGSRQLRLFGDNPHYVDHYCSVEAFEERVLGIVVADIKVRDEYHLREAMQP